MALVKYTPGFFDCNPPHSGGARKSSKFQTPTSREITSFKFQPSKGLSGIARLQKHEASGPTLISVKIEFWNLDFL
jgi:hypothetical protein